MRKGVVEIYRRRINEKSDDGWVGRYFRSWNFFFFFLLRDSSGAFLLCEILIIKVKRGYGLKTS